MGVAQGLMGQGWMGPEYAAISKVLSHSCDLYIHECLMKPQILLKNAIKCIEQLDEQYLLQIYRK